MVDLSEDVRNELRVWKAKRGLTYSKAVEKLLKEHDEDVEVLYE